MPGPDTEQSGGKSVDREIYIFESTNLQDAKSVDGVFFDDLKTHLIAKAKSGSDGKFKVKLEPGRYSVFAREPKGLFANQFDGEGCIQCVTVNAGESTEIAIEINYAAAY
jgi:hypothetical protein